jgi:hypothetical protein
MRKYIRHPSDIPITYNRVNVAANQKEPLKNISLGGLCFQSQRYIEQGTVLSIQIPLTTPTFEEQGIVIWCQPGSKYYDVGVQFMNKDTSFRVRMVEQVCYIEHYKHEVLAKEDRKLSGEEAAVEWITKYAKDFPEG